MNIAHRLGPSSRTPCIHRYGSTTDASTPAYRISGTLARVGHAACAGKRSSIGTMKTSAASACT